MELRHLRYFIAVAEEGSLTLAAEKRLHTAQPSLSRQIRDLEQEVGVQLLSRSAHGIELTPAGRAFLDHARFALGQAEAAVAAARRAAQPSKPTFALGFLTGQEMDWLPEAMRILRDELPNIQATISSQYSPDLAKDLVSGKLDVAFLRPEANMRLTTRAIHNCIRRFSNDASSSDQVCVTPPSTTSSVPVMYALSSEARKTAALPRSSAVPKRCSGIVSASPACSFSSSSTVRPGVTVWPGLSTLTRMPRLYNRMKSLRCRRLRPRWRIKQVRVSIASPLVQHSPIGRRVCIRIVTFEAC